MDDQLQREIRRLRRTNAVAVALLVIVTVSAFVRGRSAPTKFDEIDVGRINVREPDDSALRSRITRDYRTLSWAASPIRSAVGRA